MRISLRAGEKIYLNGAVFCVDRKVSLELMNDVTFLLESHVMQSKDASTPLRQLYFAVQMMLMDPESKSSLMPAAQRMFDAIEEAAPNEALERELRSVRASIENGRLFEALKMLRTLFALEDSIIGAPSLARRTPAFEGELMCK